MKARVELHLAVRDGVDAVYVRDDLMDAVSSAAPMRRCADCDSDTGPAIRAALACPLFGEPRSGVSIRCLQFTPRVERPRAR